MMRRFVFLYFIFILTLFSGCATKDKTPTFSNLMGFDEALSGAVANISSYIQNKTEIVIVGIEAPISAASDFIINQLTEHLVSSDKFVVLERSTALEAVENEHQFQTTGLVSDDSAVGIGHYLGATVVITGVFSGYENFYQLNLRVIDVRSSQLITLYSARIRPDDMIVASFMWPLTDKD